MCRFPGPAECEHVASGPMCYACWKADKRRALFWHVLAAEVHPVWPRVLLRNLAIVVALAAAEARGSVLRGMRDAPRIGF